jgi:threonine dehydrogenase-like Zn-dependent dehydrogenase
VFAGEIYQPRQVRLVDVPEQVLDEPGEILFQPELACLCGSDLLYFEGDYPEYPPRIGQSLHEMIGRVVATTGTRFSQGDRVLCVPIEHFGFYERYRVSERRAIPLDPRPNEEHALLAQPLGTVICGIKKLETVLDQDVVVVGQGPIGLLFTITLRNLGARRIIAVDLLEDRLRLSRKLGATDVIHADRVDPEDAVRQITQGRMADIVVEAVGHREQVLNQCIDLCRDRGTILFFGVPPESIPNFQTKKLFWKNISIATSVGPDFTRDFPLAMQWIAENRVDVSSLITHRFAVADIQTAFDTFAERRHGAIKVLVDFPR